MRKISSKRFEGGSYISESEEFDSDFGREEFERHVFYTKSHKIFQFRSGLQKSPKKGMVKKSAGVPKGQYAFPFTITLPDIDEAYPPSFEFEDFQMKWVLEFAFNEKFKDSVLSYQKIINLKFTTPKLAK